MNTLGKIYDGVPLYEDPHMEDNMIIKGRKENKTFFFMANPKTVNLLYKSFLTKLRKEKLNQINGI